MKENLLMNIENIKEIKKWRNTSIILFCLIILLFLISISFKNSYINDELNKNSIAEITINGIIDNNEYRENKIKSLIENDKIKAVILNIDSPGGMVTPSEILYNLIYQLNSKKPVVVIMSSMGASGAYMISLGADYIIAKNTTLTGSIGVLLQSYNIVHLAKKIGVDLKTFKSSELKGMPSLFELNNESSNKSVQSSVDDIYSYFKELVKKRRPKISNNNFKLATNGQAFTGRQALKIGLIDEIGDKNSALKFLEIKKINTKLPIIKINLTKKSNTNLLQHLSNKIFFNFNEKSIIPENNIPMLLLL